MEADTQILVFNHIDSNIVERYQKLINSWIKMGYVIEGMTSTKNDTVVILVKRG